jgi:hypothetical protein
MVTTGKKCFPTVCVSVCEVSGSVSAERRCRKQDNLASDYLVRTVPDVHTALSIVCGNRVALAEAKSKTGWLRSLLFLPPKLCVAAT